MVKISPKEQVSLFLFYICHWQSLYNHRTLADCEGGFVKSSYIPDDRIRDSHQIHQEANYIVAEQYAH